MVACLAWQTAQPGCAQHLEQPRTTFLLQLRHRFTTETRSTLLVVFLLSKQVKALTSHRAGHACRARLSCRADVGSCITTF
jgi:hypothetical protein